MIVLKFELHNAHIDAICTLFYKKKNLLLLAKIKFGKSLISKLMPFLTSTLDIILTLMPLKLLKREQSEMIYYIPYKKGIVFNKKNNTKQILIDIAIENYSYVFTNPKIDFSKKFKQNILNKLLFINCFYSFAINEIYLIRK